MSSSNIARWNHLIEEVSSFHQDLQFSLTQLLDLSERILMTAEESSNMNTGLMPATLNNGESSAQVATLKNSLQTYLEVKNSTLQFKEFMSSIRPLLNGSQFVTIRIIFGCYLNYSCLLG